MEANKIEGKVTEEMLKLGLEDDAFAEYVVQLLNEETMTREEKREAILEFLGDATEESVEGPVDELLDLYDAINLETQRLAEEARAAEVEEAKARERAAFEEGDVREDVNPANVMSREERKRRDELLKRYAYDLDEVVQVDGEDVIVYKEGGAKDGSVPLANLLPSNNNARLVKEKELAARAKSAEVHKKEKERNLELKLKQIADKDKEKRRTQKKEKRRM